MARTTKTPHKVSRNKSGTPIVRASKLFPGRPKRTTREMAFETEQQARIFAAALNLAATRDGDWRWLKGEDWPAQRRYVDEVQHTITEQPTEAPIADRSTSDVNVTARDLSRGSIAFTSGMSMTEAVETFLPVYAHRPGVAAGKNYQSWLRAVGLAFKDKSLAEVADMTPEDCGEDLWRTIDQKDKTRWRDEGLVGGRTVNSRLDSLENLLRFSIDHDWIVGQPRFFSATRWRAVEEDPPIRWWDIDELEAVRRQLQQPSNNEEVVAFLMAELLMYSGLRWGEAAALQWNDGQFGPYHWRAVDAASSLLSIRVSWKRRGETLGPTKTGNTWSAICSDNLKDTLRRTQLVTGRGNAFLFPRHENPTTAFSYKKWSDLFRGAVDRAGVTLPKGYVQKILRHSFVFAARRAKVPTEFVQLHFGHSDTRMVDKIYGCSGKEGERFELVPGEADRIRGLYDFDQFEEISARVA
jgi:integrase